MQLNISYPPNATQKTIDLEDENLCRPFYDKRIAAEVPADHLGDEWKGYVLRITGGNDKQGFAMRQGVLTNKRVKLLLDKNSPNYRERRKGCRKKKSVRGCIVDAQLSVLSCVIVKTGEKDIEGLTGASQKHHTLTHNSGSLVVVLFFKTMNLQAWRCVLVSSLIFWFLFC